MNHRFSESEPDTGRNSVITVNDTKTIPWKPDLTIDDVCLLSGYQNKYFTVLLNGKVIHKKDYHTYSVPKGAAVKIMYIVHGG